MKNYMIAGLSLKDACLLIDVSVSTWRQYEKDHPDIRRKRKQWQSMLKAQAKINLAKEIMSNKNIELSVYLLNKEEAKETKKAQNELTRARAKKANAEADIAEFKAQTLKNSGAEGVDLISEYLDKLDNLSSEELRKNGP